MPAGDPQMPGSAYAAPTDETMHIRITFVPQDIQEAYRTTVVPTFTQMVIALQHMWQPTDSLVELKWEKASAESDATIHILHEPTPPTGLPIVGHLPPDAHGSMQP